jgi:hypothetical protein
MRCIVQGTEPKKSKRHAPAAGRPDMGRSCPEGEQIETLVDHMVHDPAQAPVDAHFLEGLDTACVAQCLIDLADTSDTPEIRMSLEGVVDEGNTNVVSSRKPEANPRVGSANASVRTMQDRHAALVAMISTKMADKQEKRDDLTRHFITAISKDMPLLTQVCAPDFCAPS